MNFFATILKQIIDTLGLHGIFDGSGGRIVITPGGNIQIQGPVSVDNMNMETFLEYIQTLLDAGCSTAEVIKVVRGSQQADTALLARLDALEQVMLHRTGELSRVHRDMSAYIDLTCTYKSGDEDGQRRVYTVNPWEEDSTDEVALSVIMPTNASNDVPNERYVYIVMGDANASAPDRVVLTVNSSNELKNLRYVIDRSHRVRVDLMHAEVDLTGAHNTMRNFSHFHCGQNVGKLTIRASQLAQMTHLTVDSDNTSLVMHVVMDVMHAWKPNANLHLHKFHEIHLNIDRDVEWSQLVYAGKNVVLNITRGAMLYLNGTMHITTDMCHKLTGFGTLRLHEGIVFADGVIVSGHLRRYLTPRPGISASYTSDELHEAVVQWETPAKRVRVKVNDFDSECYFTGVPMEELELDYSEVDLKGKDTADVDLTKKLYMNENVRTLILVGQKDKITFTMEYNHLMSSNFRVNAIQLHHAHVRVEGCDDDWEPVKDMPKFSARHQDTHNSYSRLEFEFNQTGTLRTLQDIDTNDVCEHMTNVHVVVPEGVNRMDGCNFSNGTTVHVRSGQSVTFDKHTCWHEGTRIERKGAEAIKEITFLNPYLQNAWKIDMDDPESPTFAVSNIKKVCISETLEIGKHGWGDDDTSELHVDGNIAEIFNPSQCALKFKTSQEITVPARAWHQVDVDVPADVTLTHDLAMRPLDLRTGDKTKLKLSISDLSQIGKYTLKLANDITSVTVADNVEGANNVNSDVEEQKDFVSKVRDEKWFGEKVTLDKIKEDITGNLK